jgi:predicted nuclease of restriction endonuclease-like (RecB) superfamily
LLEDIKARIRTAQIKAALSVNRELIELYWSIGRDIVLRQQTRSWGKSIVDRLASDLQAAFPAMEGFSPRNVWRMRAFYLAWAATSPLPPASKPRSQNLTQSVSDLQSPRPVPILTQAVSELPHAAADIPWGHNIALFQKLDEPAQRLWYAEQTTANGWSRSMLVHWIESDLYSRRGKSVNNFKTTLPAPQSDLAQQLIKDPYQFDFLTLAADAAEREVEQGLLAHIRRFLLELGAGFAFVGQQVRLEVDGYLKLVEALPKQLAASLPSVNQIEAELATETAAGKPKNRRGKKPASGKRGKG